MAAMMPTPPPVDPAVPYGKLGHYKCPDCLAPLREDWTGGHRFQKCSVAAQLRDRVVDVAVTRLEWTGEVVHGFFEHKGVPSFAPINYLNGEPMRLENMRDLEADLPTDGAGIHFSISPIVISVVPDTPDTVI